MHEKSIAGEKWDRRPRDDRDTSDRDEPAARDGGPGSVRTPVDRMVRRGFDDSMLRTINRGKGRGVGKPRIC